jgi:hypothetical protein
MSSNEQTKPARYAAYFHTNVLRTEACMVFAWKWSPAEAAVAASRSMPQP